MSSIDDFKNLEDRVKEQNEKYHNTYLENQKKNQKLFDDDDSDSNGEEIEKDNRSNLVKKMFYKDENKPNSSSGATRYKGGAADPNSNMAMPESVQKILDQKKEQLDKAMKYYN